MNRHFFYFCFLAFSIYAEKALAEYRVFELEITTYDKDLTTVVPGVTNPKPEAIGSTIVISNLDPQQYRGYYTVQPNQHVRYKSTWRCPGRTSNKDYCPNPKVKTETSNESAALESK